jgi:hypothetical protein
MCNLYAQQASRSQNALRSASRKNLLLAAKAMGIPEGPGGRKLKPIIDAGKTKRARFLHPSLG